MTEAARNSPVWQNIKIKNVDLLAFFAKLKESWGVLIVATGFYGTRHECEWLRTATPNLKPGSPTTASAIIVNILPQKIFLWFLLLFRELQWRQSKIMDMCYLVFIVTKGKKFLANNTSRVIFKIFQRMSSTSTSVKGVSHRRRCRCLILYIDLFASFIQLQGLKFHPAVSEVRYHSIVRLIFVT